MSESNFPSAEERFYLPDFMGRIVEVGRDEHGKSYVMVDLGHTAILTISGMSDAAAKKFALALYQPVRIESGVLRE